MVETAPHPPGLLTQKQAAAYLNYSVRQVQRFSGGRRPRLRAVRTSKKGKPRYRREDLDRFIAEHTR